MPTSRNVVGTQSAQEAKEGFWGVHFRHAEGLQNAALLLFCGRLVGEQHARQQLAGAVAVRHTDDRLALFTRRRSANSIFAKDGKV